jgi:hypothetical protein
VIAADFSVRMGWRRMVFFAWLLICTALIVAKWHDIATLTLSDTDDNLRMAQVRDWLGGQGWFDLRQYRLGPSSGLNIHWTRLVDLPLAGLILISKPMLGGAGAERLAVAVAPLLPLGVVFACSAATARRLIAPSAYWLALAYLVLAPFALGMFAPTRIDHHGWQLAALSLLALSLTGGAARRSALLAGAAIGLSLSIGLEMIPFLMIAGIVIVGKWLYNTNRDDSLFWFAGALAVTSALGYWGFASNDNRQPLCDALTPIWLTLVLAGSALPCVLSFYRQKSLAALLTLTVLGAAAIIAFAFNSWPSCFVSLEGATPELRHLWLDNVTEAQPVTSQDLRSAIKMASLPLFGLLGSGWMIWTRRGNRLALTKCLPFLILAAAGAALIFVQARITPAAQILAIPAVTFAAWRMLPLLQNTPQMLVRVFGIVALLFVPSGLALTVALDLWPQPQAVSTAASNAPVTSRCENPDAFVPLTSLPAATLLTFIDLGPRLIVNTHHRALAGPYHRNGNAILDVIHAFNGSEQQARDSAKARGATMILICPSLDEAQHYLRRSPQGFYAGLANGHAPAWLEAVDLGASSPFKLWRVKP